MSRPLVPMEAIGAIEAARIWLDRQDRINEIADEGSDAEFMDAARAELRAIEQFRAALALYDEAYPKEPVQ